MLRRGVPVIIPEPVRNELLQRVQTREVRLVLPRDLCHPEAYNSRKERNHLVVHLLVRVVLGSHRHLFAVGELQPRISWEGIWDRVRGRSGGRRGSGIRRCHAHLGDLPRVCTLNTEPTWVGRQQEGRDRVGEREGEEDARLGHHRISLRWLVARWWIPARRPSHCECFLWPKLSRWLAGLSASHAEHGGQVHADVCGGPGGVGAGPGGYRAGGLCLVVTPCVVADGE